MQPRTRRLGRDQADDHQSQLTEDDDVQNQDNKTQDATTSAIRPGIIDGRGSDDGRGRGKGSPDELEENGGDDGLHLDGLPSRDL
jgi:hypothetical protein